MKRRNIPRSTPKAASAALALLALCPAANASQPGHTVPEARTQMMEERFDGARRAFETHLPQTPLLLKDFLNDFPASSRSDEATLMLADWYFYSGEYPLALSLYSAIREGAFSGDIRDGMLYRKAFALIKTGFYSEAAALLRPLSTSSQYGYDARFYLAYIDYVEGNYSEAYKAFSALKAGGPKGAEAEYYLNQMDYRNGDYRRVAVTSERLLSVPIPDELRAETMRVGGLANFKTGNTPMARSILQNYATLTGDGAELSALYALATIYYDEGDYERALPLFTVVAESDGELAQSAWLYIGQISLIRGDASAAALAFDKAARESWNTAVAETAGYNLAVTSASGMALPFSDAARAMETFIDTYPSSPYASTLSSYLANAYYGRRDYASALRQVDKVALPDARVKAMRQKILYQLGISQLQQGQPAEAIRSLSEAASSDADREVAAQSYLWLGDAYYAAKKYSDAVKAYESAIASRLLGPNEGIAQYNLGYACLKTRSYRKAEKAFDAALKSGSLAPALKADARLRYADCLYYNGKYAEALAIFRDARLDGGSDAVFAAIREADILGREGRVADKITILESLLTNPDAGIWRATLLERLGDAYSEQGNDRKAAEIYAMMLDANSNADNSQTYYSLATNADNLYRTGDTDAAYAAYKRLEASGIPALYPAAIVGVMRTARNIEETAEYASKAAALPGLTPEETDEALFRGAEASLSLGSFAAAQALETLSTLARSSDRLWGARAAVTLGEELLRQGNPDGAEEILLHLIDNGSDDNYWLARGYIALADAYTAQEKDYLARLYLETLQANYPGSEKDIKDMINSRLKALKK